MANIHWLLNSFHLTWLAALLSFALRHTVGRLVGAECLYSTGQVPGYVSYYWIRGIGTVSFRREDGSWQYRW